MGCGSQGAGVHGGHSSWACPPRSPRGSYAWPNWAGEPSTARWPVTCNPRGLKDVTLQKLNQETQQRHALWQWERKHRVMDKGAKRPPWLWAGPARTGLHAWGRKGRGGHSWAGRAETGVGKRQTGRQRTQRDTHTQEERRREGGKREGQTGRERGANRAAEERRWERAGGRETHGGRGAERGMEGRKRERETERRRKRAHKGGEQTPESPGQRAGCALITPPPHWDLGEAPSPCTHRLSRGSVGPPMGVTAAPPLPQAHTGWAPCSVPNQLSLHFPEPHFPHL